MKAGATTVAAWLVLAAVLACRVPVANGAEQPSRTDTNSIAQSTNSSAMRSAREKYEQGMKYLDGEGVSEDAQKGGAFIRQAAEAGLPEAQCEIGFLLMNGLGTAQNQAEAVEWYRKAAMQGLAEAQWSLGLAYRNGRGIPKQLEQAFKWFSKAAEQEHAKGQTDLGRCYQDGSGVAQDNAAAVKWFRKSAEQGYPLAAMELGSCYSNGRGVSTNRIEAYKWFSIADASDTLPSGSGYAEKLKRLAAEMTAGEVAEAQRLADSFVIPEKAKREIAETMWLIGNGCLDLGKATNAARLIRKAAELGNPKAQSRLASMYELGQGLDKDDAEAAKWALKAAEAGEVEAMNRLGVLYGGGFGVEKDAAKAVIWYRKAAEQGEIAAQFNLGQMYNEGEEVKPDYKEAMKWYSLVAASKDSESESHAYFGLMAQARLGAMYRQGRGGNQNYGEALRLLRDSGVRGEHFAQFQLGTMYSSGEGVPRNYLEACFWLNLASSYEPQARAALDRLETMMTPDQIAEGQRRAAAFVPKKKGSQQAGEQAEERDVRSEVVGSGTGFFITADGYLLTSQHVVEDAARVMVQCGAGKLSAKVVAKDAANDLALLKVSGSFKPLPLASSRAVKLGDAVFTVGFPNVALQGQSPKLTKGEISSLAGAQDDPRHFQISVAVQPGNSGGPLVTESGAVIGVEGTSLISLRSRAVILQPEYVFGIRLRDIELQIEIERRTGSRIHPLVDFRMAVAEGEAGGPVVVARGKIHHRGRGQVRVSIH